MAITDGFNHVATLTTDLDRFTAWYLRVFEAPVVFEMAAEGDPVSYTHLTLPTTERV